MTSWVRSLVLALAALSTARAASPQVAAEGRPPTTASGPSSSSRTVLVLIPAQPGRALFDGVARGIITELKRGPVPVNAVVEPLYDGQDPPEVLAGQVAFLRSRYAHRRVDLVIAYGHSRYRTIREDLGLSPIPMVWFVGGRLPIEAPPAGVVLARTRTEATPATYAASRGLLPPGHRVALVGGASAADLAANRATMARLAGWLPADHIHDLTGLTLDETRTRVSQLSRDTFVLIGSVISDASGRALSYPDVLGALAPVARGPILTTSESGLGLGAAGGLVYDFEAVGGELARVARRLLDGSTAAPTPPVVLTPLLVFDASVLDRLRIPRDRVPAGATLRNDRRTLWQAYGHWLVLAAVALLLQAALIATLLVERRRRRESQGRLAERLALQALVAEVSSSLTNLPDQALDHHLIERRLDRVGRVLQAETCAVWTWHDEGGTPHLVSRWTRSDGAGQATAADDEAVLAHARARLDLGEEVQQGHDPSGGRPAGASAALVLPLQVDGRVFGAFVLRHPSSHAWSREILADLRTIGEILATAVIRKRTDASMRQQGEALAHVNRVAGLGQLAASLAHELNQPLAAILTNAEVAHQLLERDAPPIADVRAILADVIEDDQRAGDIIRNMRTMLRGHPVDATPVDVNAAVMDVARFLAHEAGQRGARLDLSLGEALPRATIDLTQLKQVVLNLVVNAFDAQAKGISDSPVEIRTGTRDGGLEIEVRDHGPGIAPEVMPRLFDPFFTTKADGLGVGLAITRSIVESARGRITASNVPAGGAAFRVWLPDATRAIGAGRAACAPASPPAAT